MSKHTWLTKPSESKRVTLERAFHAAIRNGFTRAQARCFAGYFLECQTQNGRALVPGRKSLHQRIEGAKASGHRYAKGKNAVNYTRCFENHVPLMLDQDYRIAGLSPETPPLILADWLEEHGDMEKANYVRSLVQD